MLANLARRSAMGIKTARFAQARISAPVAVRSFSADYVEPPAEYTDKGALIVENVAFSLEWILSSPPPLHAFEEPPIMVEWPEGEAGGH
mmetsp:Transcript_20749/g.30713  ORF Transcript_20749/g.30713 Transcript_20749/m.30713 type:complete len:89 (-) Transcript_20749:59-325(-)|eukprot:CAMPEP_0171453070 /NCGR_PEP_ID=MMETSP0945-20130129/928_1 /TAXON_ID=109269 /ORGANISM="Vaucheria litorea, Strain CCMP2940" /LENGTH=88 /DNA_ID=CAMNT_0011977869 /DNA_START=65 /DNA_END=331 /DNA_ORIENTATION=-